MFAKKKKRLQKPPPRIQLWGGAFGAAVIIALLSFISMPLAALGVICVAIASVMYEERRQLATRNKNIDTQLETMDESVQNLTVRERQNRSDIERLKSDVMTIRQERAIEASERAAQNVFSKPIIEAQSSPRAIRPGVRVTKSTMQAPHRDPNYNASDYDFVSDVIVQELLNHALDQKRIDVFVQPIVRLPQRQARFYEMYARIRAKAGLYLPASRYMKVAEQDNLNGRIDDLLLLHCLQTIEESAHLDKATPFFININSQTVRNGAFMKRLLGFIAKNRSLAKRMIFEISQSDFNSLEPALLEIMRGLGKLGCAFSLDHIEDISTFDIENLQRHKVRFIKMRADILLSSKEAERTKRTLEGNGVGVIIERIEKEEQLRSLTDMDVHYGQGYLFGKPELEGAYKDRSRAKRAGFKENYG